MKAQTNHILQKTKKMELIPYASNSKVESKENESEIKQKQWWNFREWNSSPVIRKLMKHLYVRKIKKIAPIWTVAGKKAILKSARKKDDLVLARIWFLNSSNTLVYYSGNVCYEPYQKQPSRGVLRKRCSENIQQIYRRMPMPKCNLNKVALQLYWNHTSVWLFSWKFAAYFQNTFS